jgi:hypothetical protein
MPVTRLPVVGNPAYKANGLKSYIYALNKFNITPVHTNLITRNSISKKLIIKATDGNETEVTTDNQQNDAFFTTPVQVGTPPQTMQLVYHFSLHICDVLTRSGLRFGFR